jgi:DNA repair protein RadC
MTKLFELKKIKTDFPSVKISTSMDAYKFIKPFYGDTIEIFESFFILMVSRNNKTVGYAKISQGGTCGTVVDTKIIAKYCLDSLCQGVILAHNHPSRDAEPSQSDIEMTKKIKQGLRLIDVEVLDHMIITENNYYSLADNGEI